MANISRRHPHQDLTPSFDTWVDNFFSGNLNQMFNRMMPTGLNLPAVNITESADSYHLEMATPGFRKGDIHVSMQENTLIISGEHKAEQKQTDHHVRRQEFMRSSFRKAFTLPDNIEHDKLHCAYEDGVLKLDVPKVLKNPELGARDIPIK